MLKRSLAVLLIALFALATLTFADDHVRQPKLTPQNSNTTQGLIAVSPVNERVVWASGRGGTFVVTTDGGHHWRSGVVPGAEALQFRDVEGVSDRVAYLQSIGNNPTDFRIYKTTDGGATWTMQFQNQLAGAFYDCFAFWSPTRGISHSDSVNGVFPDLRIRNGHTWKSISANMPPALPGEASFAASGTCVATEGERNAWIATGGSTAARILATTDGGNTWNAYDTPLVSNPSAGAFTRRLPRLPPRHRRRRRPRPCRSQQRIHRYLQRWRPHLDSGQSNSCNGSDFRFGLRGWWTPQPSQRR